MSEKINIDDPLLKFFHELLESEEEKEIISMIFKNYKEDQIIEKLIGYSNEENKEEDL
jgi:hypothetical protein